MKMKKIYFILLILCIIFATSCSTATNPVDGLQYRIGSYNSAYGTGAYIFHNIVITSTTIIISYKEGDYSCTIDLNTAEYQKTDTALNFFNIVGKKSSSDQTFTTITLRFIDSSSYTTIECMLAPEGEIGVDFSASKSN